MKICWTLVGDNFLDEFKEELEKLLKKTIHIKVTNVCENCGVTEIDFLIDGPIPDIHFIILPLYSNCGAAVVTNINYPQVKGIKRISFIKIIDRCIHKCMQEIQRVAAYYTNSENDKILISLKNVGFKEIGTRWKNINSGNKIVTLRKDYEIIPEDNPEEGEPDCDNCEEGNCDNCQYT